jgi:hypothetical protein
VLVNVIVYRQNVISMKAGHSDCGDTYLDSLGIATSTNKNNLEIIS